MNGNALLISARALMSDDKRRKNAVSHWDASGIFGEVVVAEDAAGRPSARTLLLLYAADLAFRLRWEIRPALTERVQVVAVPYVETAMAFGRAAGLDRVWLADILAFAPRPGEQRIVSAAPALSISDRNGFVEFGCQQLAGAHSGPPRRQLLEHTARYLGEEK